MTGPYVELDQSQREIRLLELAPGRYEDDLVLGLRIASLDRELPNYHALSYAWGQATSSRAALVDGSKTAIGHNLDCALRHICCTLERPTLMWVDALCINQHDLDERSSQVLLMKDIYSLAERVLIYLGPERPGDVDAIASIQYDQVPESEEAAHVLLSRVESICQRAWFERVWVAQELALSQKDPKVYLGTSILPWSAFYEYIINLERRKPSSLDGHPRIFSFMQIVDQVRRLGRVRAFRTTSFNLQIYRSAPALATDPRDKVFGLLGICAPNAGQAVITPDYTKSTQRVFTEATISMLQEGDNLPYGLLPLQPPRNIPEGSPYRRLPDLPSWVLDLNISSQVPGLCGQNGPYWLIPNCAVHPGALLKHTNHITNRVRVSNDLTRLYTPGAHLGTIVAVYTSAINADCFGYHKRATALREIYHTYMKPRQISAQSLLHALTVDRKPPVLDPQLAKQFPVLFQQLLESPAEITFPSPFFDVMVALSGHEECHLFFTNEDKVGITYHPDLEAGVRVGDVVAGLLGINFPFVLRSVEGGVGGEAAYTMINVAHIADHQWEHDFLEDARPDARWSDFGDYGLKEFTVV
ncbi:hypothetical protein N0V86_006718 [Didymella sp. IMI 355093]|nr:hypothetical protein N0V86_006718 [Didymella sp. IMI 355093]